MKSAYKTEFYKIAKSNAPEALNFVEAAEIFEAAMMEEPVALPENHHGHVQKAIQLFEEELLSSSTDSVSGDQADANTGRAKKFIREVRVSLQDDKAKEACNHLYELLEKGTITKLPNELKKLKSKHDKEELPPEQLAHILMQLAVKYGKQADEATGTAEEFDLPIEVTEKPVIILSETFSS
jgi:hypothetical protein